MIKSIFEYDGFTPLINFTRLLFGVFVVVSLCRFWRRLITLMKTLVKISR